MPNMASPVGCRVILIVLSISMLAIAAMGEQSDKAKEVLSKKFDDFKKTFNKNYKNRIDEDHRYHVDRNYQQHSW